eukprot:scaffold12706_cov90-Isochrysis_galbana.AAC.2
MPRRGAAVACSCGGVRPNSPSSPPVAPSPTTAPGLIPEGGEAVISLRYLVTWVPYSIIGVKAR